MWNLKGQKAKQDAVVTGREKKYTNKNNEVVLARPATRKEVFETDYHGDYQGYALIYPDNQSCWISKENFEKHFTLLQIEQVPN